MSSFFCQLILVQPLRSILHCRLYLLLPVCDTSAIHLVHDHLVVRSILRQLGLHLLEQIYDLPHWKRFVSGGLQDEIRVQLCNRTVQSGGLRDSCLKLERVRRHLNFTVRSLLAGFRQIIIAIRLEAASGEAVINFFTVAKNSSPAPAPNYLSTEIREAS